MAPVVLYNRNKPGENLELNPGNVDGVHNERSNFVRNGRNYKGVVTHSTVRDEDGRGDLLHLVSVTVIGPDGRPVLKTDLGLNDEVRLVEGSDDFIRHGTIES